MLLEDITFIETQHNALLNFSFFWFYLQQKWDGLVKHLLDRVSSLNKKYPMVGFHDVTFSD